MSAETIVETRLIQPGRPTGVYEVTEEGSLCLKEVSLPEVVMPFDIAVVPDTLDESGENLQVILIGEISHPTHTRVDARILGGIHKYGAAPLLLGVAVADSRYRSTTQIAELPDFLQESLLDFMRTSDQNLENEPGNPQILDANTTRALVQQAVARFRQTQLDIDRGASTQPSWRPTDRKRRIVGHTETEHYTDAEYTYFQLPFRFQRYMDQHLAGDERILFALSRSAMRSQIHSTFLSRKKLQEGVLILTDQRLVHLVELVPPGSSGVRYGFEARMGILERLQDASIEPLENQAMILSTSWRARDGVESLGWEFPNECQPYLEKLLDLLAEWLTDSRESTALRRAALPPYPESIPPLKDPAANDPNAVEPIVQRFYSSLSVWLNPGEALIAWSMLPAWFEKKGYARVLLVTSQRIRIIPDPIRSPDPEIDLPYERVATLAYTSSILSSHIDISVQGSRELKQVTINFPYSTEHGFHACFEGIRRCVAMIPVW